MEINFTCEAYPSPFVKWVKLGEIDHVICISNDIGILTHDHHLRKVRCFRLTASAGLGSNLLSTIGVAGFRKTSLV